MYDEQIATSDTGLSSHVTHNNDNNNYTFPVRRLGVHLDHLLTHTIP
jgi:hypothetical protein